MSQVDGMTFSGTGPSKAIAKNICAEHAIQYVVSKRCTDPKNKEQTDAGGNPLKPNQVKMKGRIDIIIEWFNINIHHQLYN